MELQYIILNGEKVIGLPAFLEALLKAHKELVQLRIGHGNKIGFVPADETTCSWRSLIKQKQLVASGASKTLESNHRRGLAVDCVADWGYINKIAPVMRKYHLINDLAYLNGALTSADPLPGYVAWDGGHWNYGSNKIAQGYPLIDVLPPILKEFSMNDYEGKLVQLVEAGFPGESGSFALVLGGKKRRISNNRLAQALATLIVRKENTGLAKKGWDELPDGENF